MANLHQSLGVERAEFGTSLEQQAARQQWASGIRRDLGGVPIEHSTFQWTSSDVHGVIRTNFPTLR